MPSLLSMRNLPDDIPPLGERLPRADEEPVRTPPDEVVRPGILRDPTTGRLRTDIPTEAEKVLPPTPLAIMNELLVYLDGLLRRFP